MPRVVLLGASNVTLAFPRLWHGLQRVWSEPLELFAADGHGRSYGNWSRVGPRGLPGISACQLWETLESQPTTSTAQVRALITDVGNDLLYGVEADQVSAWIESCLQRLQRLDARIVVTSLPVASVQKVSRRRFEFLKSMMFPGSQMSFDEVEPKMLRLNHLVAELARTYGADFIEKRGEWYGFDPIHIRRRYRAVAWNTILTPWFDDPNEVRFPSVGLHRSSLIWRQRPAERRWREKTQKTVQPTLCEPNGSALWLF